MAASRQSSQPGEDTPFDFADTLERAKRGEQEALAALTERYYARVEAMVHRDLASDVRRGRPWLASRFSTCDIVQDVFRSMLQDLHQFQVPAEGAFVTYLAMVARNRLMDALRYHQAEQRDGRRTSAIPEGVDPSSRSRGPATGAQGREELERFHAALAEFPLNEQLLLRERVERQTPFDELAEALGYSSRWAARRAFYAAQAKLVIRLKALREDGR